MHDTTLQAAVTSATTKPDFDDAIGESYNALALLTVAIECANSLTENLEYPHNQTTGSLKRLMEIVSRQVAGTIDKMEGSRLAI